MGIARYRLSFPGRSWQVN